MQIIIRTFLNKLKLKCTALHELLRAIKRIKVQLKSQVENRPCHALEKIN